ncbi:MAG: glycoside hydrolase family 31 protein [Armatimonadota bacterium]|nr:glycoside hydrolase family 31 protein [Armatimonadota bacterium]MDR7548544.1 glycoside hydrolase family 31 protein [Armatimonadota bacterium]
MNNHPLLAALRVVGARGVARSVHYSVVRWLVSRRFRLPQPTGTPEPPGHGQGATPLAGGARFRFDRADLEIRFLAADLVRVTWGPGTLPVPYALAKTDWPEVPVGLREKAGRWVLASEALRVEVGLDGALQFLDPSGRVLRNDAPPLRRGEEVILRTALRQEEHVYGLGHRTVPLNLRGRTYQMWNRDPGAGHSPLDDPIYLCIPVSLAVHADGSYLVFYENSFRGTFTLGETAEAHFEGGALRYYVIPGPPARALERYTDLTGRPPLPPRWALGYHQSRWSYDTEAEVREIVDGFRDHGLPLSAIHLDIDYMDGFRVFTVSPRRFPGLAALARELLEREIRLVAIIDPGVKVDRGYDVFTHGERGEVFCQLPDGSLATAPVWPGWCAFPDFTDPRARAWWGRWYPRLLNLGISGFWHDMNEPAAFAAWGDPTLPDPVRHALDGRGGDHREAHNLYGFLENQAGYEALRALRPDARPFILSRSGWAGVQRYAWTWTGDIESTWRALRQTVATVINLGLSGVPYTGPDVGGFSGAPSAELYLRWLQLAAFLPFFRTHSAKFTPRREPWAFGTQALQIAREVLRLRYRLLPYLYTLAWEASRTGHPLVRPLWWPEAGNPALWDVQDAFFLGDALLVAPVLDEGARSREVTLPSGTWYEMGSDRAHRGPGRVALDAPLDRIPVLARAGSVLPMAGPPEGSAGETLALQVYRPDGSPGGGILYSDAGDGYGPGRLDHFTLHPDGGRLRIVWTTEGTYPFPYGEVDVHVYGLPVCRVTVDGGRVPCEHNRFRTGPFREASCEP